MRTYTSAVKIRKSAYHYTATRFLVLHQFLCNNPISANLNPRFSSREDFVVTSIIVNEMKLRDDPRMEFYFTTADTIAYDAYENGEPVEGANPLDTLTVYVGGKYGFSNTYADFSHPGDKLIAPAFEGMQMEYSEIAFLLAEAKERGFAVPGTAEDHYRNAVKASILYWGGTEAEADAYLLQPSVAYATAGANYKEKIGTQKWIALFNRGWESWME